MDVRAPVRAGIIAAGLGERLKASGPMKPLVPVLGRPLIDRVLEAIGDAGATEAVVIINEASTAIRDHVAAAEWPFAIRWIVRTTPSSMHSFLLVLEALGGDQPVLLSTVDTLAPPGAFGEFVRAAREGDADVTLALTRLVDDEKPLRVVLEGRRVTAMGDAAAGSPLATAGYYFVHPRVLREADLARRDQVPALRAFLSRLVARGYRVDGIIMPDSIDVDRPADVAAAEQLLR